MKVRPKIGFFVGILVVFLLSFCTSPQELGRTVASRTVEQSQVSDPLFAENGMVVSAHAEASRAGVEILQRGGNAVDAAVATGFALAVVYPVAGNIGGGGFLVFRAADGTATTFDYREKAPLAATADMFLDDDGDFVPQRSLRGYLASGVPGAVAGMVKAQKQYGVLKLSEVLEPAIRLAERGFILTRRHAARLNGPRESFKAFPGTARYFTKPGAGEVFAEGERFVQSDLGKTLRRIAENGHDGFYRGPTADMIVAEMRRGDGLITHEDLAQYEAVERAPVTGSYRGHKIISMAPPSSGGVALLQLLNAVEPFDLSTLGYHSSETLHLYGEAMRRVYADRSEWLGDSDFFDVPINGLIEKSYMNARMADVDPDNVTPSNTIDYGQPVGYESSETTHYSVVDKSGNAVSVTTTINGGFGSHVVVDGAGFFLNNEMDDFSAKPGTPNVYGLVGSEANKIEPGKRMLSSMTPTIVEDPAGRLLLVVGTPGGSTIITTVFQVIVNVIDYGMNIQQAVSSPRVHHQWLPDMFYHEAFAFPNDVSRNLKKRGWNLSERRGSSGLCDAISVGYSVQDVSTDPSGVGQYRSSGTGVLYYGGADPRGEDTAVGY